MKPAMSCARQVVCQVIKFSVSLCMLLYTCLCIHCEKSAALVFFGRKFEFACLLLRQCTCSAVIFFGLQVLIVNYIPFLMEAQSFYLQI